MEKLLPQNIEAERGVLGSIIIDPDALYDVAAFLHAADFYRDAHKTIYEAMLLLHNNQEQADFITICDTLERQNMLSQVGGASYITSLINQVPTASRAVNYGRIVRRTATLRRLIHAAGEIAAMAYDEVEADVVLDKSEQLICAIAQQADSAVGRSTGLVSFSEAMMRFMDGLDKKHVALETGFTDLDYLIGGLQPQEVYVIGGRPGEGKTALILNMIYNLWERKARIAMFSMEMSLEALMGRLVSMHMQINSQRIRTKMLTDDDWSKIAQAAGDFGGSPVHFDETPALTIGQIRSRARRHQMQHGLDVILVDYLQLAKGDGSYSGKDRRLEVDEIAEGLKAMAKELHVPVIACASLKRTDKSDGAAPSLSDLRESGGIEFAADVAMFIRRSREQKGYSIINVEKHRNGPVGEVTLKFEPSLTRFLNVAGETRDKALAAQSVWPREEVHV